MADFITVPTLNAALDTIQVTMASLHTGDPGPNGTDNELATAGYARQAAAFNAASAGARQLNANVSFQVVAGQTITHVGYWNGAAFTMSSDIADLPIGGPGALILNAVTTQIRF